MSKQETLLGREANLSNNRLAIDVGGTFVDFVYFDEASNEVIIEKVPSSGKLE